MYAINTEFIVQVWARCQTGASYIANHFALFYPIAFLQAFGEFTQVCIKGGVSITVLNFDSIAVGAFHTGKYNAAVTGSTDRCAGWCAIVHTLVRADCVANGVLAL